MISLVKGRIHDTLHSGKFDRKLDKKVVIRRLPCRILLRVFTVALKRVDCAVAIYDIESVTQSGRYVKVCKTQQINQADQSRS